MTINAYLDPDDALPESSQLREWLTPDLGITDSFARIHHAHIRETAEFSAARLLENDWSYCEIAPADATLYRAMVTFTGREWYPWSIAFGTDTRSGMVQWNMGTQPYLPTDTLITDLCGSNGDDSHTEVVCWVWLSYLTKAMRGFALPWLK